MNNEIPFLDYNEFSVQENFSFGGYSTVYRGEFNERKVAIKVFDKPKKLRERIFSREECLAEFANLSKARSFLSDDLKEFIQIPIGVSKNNFGQAVLLTGLVCDYSGEISKTLEQSPEIHSQFFFISCLRNILFFLGSKGVYNMDLNSRNILVKQTLLGPQPVLIDFQKADSYHYPILKLYEKLGLDSFSKRYNRRVLRRLESII